MAQNTSNLIEKLNAVLSWELAGMIQNMNHAALITGVRRLEFGSMFKANSQENHTHAEQLAERIAALGGVPTVEPAKIRQAATLEEMLEASLALELDAMEAWKAALEASSVAPAGITYWLEDMISEEQQHIDEFRMLTSKVTFTTSDVRAAKTAQ